MAKIEIEDKLYEKFKLHVAEENLNEKQEIENLIKDYIKTKKLIKFVKDNKG